MRCPANQWVPFHLDNDRTFQRIVLMTRCQTDMEFVKNFTPPDLQAKNLTLSISSNFNSFSDKNTKK